MSRRDAGFTLTDAVIIIACLGLLAVLIVPVFLGCPQNKPWKTINNMQVRGIHSVMVYYAQDNNGHYPGVMSDGKTIDPSVGLSPQGRIQVLIDRHYITQEYAHSPSEEQTGPTSYAMLKLDYNADDALAQTTRNMEWRDTGHAQSIVISDRAIASPNSTEYDSIHSSKIKTTGWIGSVGWNDNHVTFENTTTFATKYDTTEHASDDLFTTSSTNAGDDAFMVWSSTDSL